MLIFCQTCQMSFLIDLIKKTQCNMGTIFVLLLIVAELKIKRKTDKSLIIKIPADDNKMFL